MTNVEITYNPFLVTTDIRINGKASEGAWKERAKGGVRLQVWLADLFPDLVDECNDDLSITFRGTPLDYEDVRAAAAEYSEQHPETKITFKKPVLSANTEGRLDQLKKLFQKLHQECPFEDLRSDKIERAFKETMGTTFKVSVIATMSSGKSTLINAMLGRELLPAKNAACTATIAQIQDDDSQENFSAVCLDADGNVLAETDSLTAEQMAEYNDNPKVAYIDVKGDIPFVASKNTQLVLEDTPGPNNSRTAEHRRHTYGVIKSEAKPMILYVLNATQLGTNDDSQLLGDVAAAMKVGGKQSRDRFIFVANKADAVDPEKESLTGMMEHVKEYLESKGIINPAIYPVSAEYAKVIRMEQAGSDLTRAQKREYRVAPDTFNGYEDMYLERYAPLSPAIRSTLQRALEIQKNSDDEEAEYNEAIIHTGVPGVEMAIREYVEKYALTNKITTGVATFQQKIEEKHLENDLLETLQGNEAERKKLQEQIALVEKQIKSGETNSFKAKMNQAIKKVDKDITARGKDIFNRFNGAVDEVDRDAKLSPDDALIFVEGLLREAKDIEDNLKSELEKMVDSTVGITAQHLVQEYNAQYRMLLQGKTINSNIGTAIDVMMSSMPTADYFVTAYQKERKWKEKTGEQWAGNKNKAWYKPWTWFDDEYHKVRDIYEEHSEVYVRGDSINNEYVAPLLESIDDNIRDATTNAKEEAKDFEQWFQKQLADIDKIVQQKAKELKSATSSQDSINKKMAADKKKLNWLREFQKELDEVLRV